jgi:hypothetical protein
MKNSKSNNWKVELAKQIAIMVLDFIKEAVKNK